MSPLPLALFSLVLGPPAVQPKPAAQPKPVAQPKAATQPAASTGGAEAEAPGDARGAAPTPMRALVRTLLLRVGEPVDLTLAEQARFDDVVAALTTGDDAGADTNWRALVAAHVARTGARNVDALMAAVMMRVWLGPEAQFHEQLTKLVANNVARKQLRDHVADLGRRLAARPPKAKQLQVPTVSIANLADGGKRVELGQTETFDLGQLEAYLAELEQVQDSLSELAQEQQLRLQMVMDRQQKAATTRSNALKKLSDTSSQIISNIK